MASVTKQTVSAGDAVRLIEAAQSKAKEMGVAATVAIVDESGILKAFGRMDGAGRGRLSGRW
jgi:uncharacterized protein GlcG (DUF336 family)